MANEEATNYGPLTMLIGSWKGDKGMDIAPQREGQEENPYYETIDFEKAGDVTNAGVQKLAIIRYHLSVREKSNDEVSHDQVGYWMWDQEKQTIIHSFTIPRGVGVIASGNFNAAKANDNDIAFNVSAKTGGEWGVIQSPFMQENAKTTEFTQEFSFNREELTYSQTMVLDIYGKIFNHTDGNTLRKV